MRTGACVSPSWPGGEERKFLGFSISNDGSERRIAPKALDKFKGQIRDMTRRTRGFGLQQLIKELKPYIVGWRGYFGFCQTPRVLTNLEAWIRRGFRLYLVGNGEPGKTASRGYAVAA
jgi:RNA-directed DNA polymerase